MRRKCYCTEIETGLSSIWKDGEKDLTEDITFNCGFLWTLMDKSWTGKELGKESLGKDNHEGLCHFMTKSNSLV